MDMQDKEFDRLFNSKIGDLEVEPSPMVWQNIANELDDKKAKRSIAPYLSIAASIVILASVGWLFLNKTEESFVKPKRSKVVAKINKVEEPDTLAKGNTVESVLAKVTINKAATVSKRTVFIAPKVIVDEPAKLVIAETNEPVALNPGQVNQPVLTTVIDPVQKHDDKVVINKQEEIEPTITTSTETINEPTKKQGIHSLGGLINAIVAKVDKREDKLIEFTENEENSSTITGLNLGFVRIKKK